MFFLLTNTQDVVYNSLTNNLKDARPNPRLCTFFALNGRGSRKKETKMKLIKRSGAEETFTAEKISAAIVKANEAVAESERISEQDIKKITERVEKKCEKLRRAVSVEEVQDMVEEEIMRIGAYVLAKAYITYRYKRALVRRTNTTDDKILSLIECNNEEVKQENSNKNPTVNSVQRDYMAGEISKDITT